MLVQRTTMQAGSILKEELCTIEILLTISHVTFTLRNVSGNGFHV